MGRASSRGEGLAGEGIRGQAGRAARTLTPGPSPGREERGAAMAAWWWETGVATPRGSRTRRAKAPLPRTGRGVGVRVLWRDAAASGQYLPLPGGDGGPRRGAWGRGWVTARWGRRRRAWIACRR